MALIIALIAAMLAGTGFVLQQHAAEQVPQTAFLRLRLLRCLAVKPWWLVGVAVMTVGDVLDAWALGHLRLSLAEPLQTTSLIFALLLAVPLSGQRLRKTELIGGAMLCAGVAGLSVAVSEPGPGISVGSFAYWPAAAGIGALAFVFARVGRRRAGVQRAVLAGVASGLLFGIADALTRRTVQILDGHSFVAVLTSWQAYSMIAASLIGLWLMESAFNAGPVHASLPGLTAAEPVAGMLLGVVVFGDVVRVSPGMIALQATAILALIAGVIMVARAPMLSGPRPGHAIRRHRDGHGQERGPRAAARNGPGTGAPPAPASPVKPAPSPAPATPIAPAPALAPAPTAQPVPAPSPRSPAGLLGDP